MVEYDKSPLSLSVCLFVSPSIHLISVVYAVILMAWPNHAVSCIPGNGAAFFRNYIQALSFKSKQINPFHLYDMIRLRSIWHFGSEGVMHFLTKEHTNLTPTAGSHSYTPFPPPLKPLGEEVRTS